MSVVNAIAVVVLGLALAPLLLFVGRRSGPAAALRLALALAAAALLHLGLRPASRPLPARTEAAALEQPGDGYLGSRACRACHPAEYRSWAASYHHSMTRPATAEWVRAPLAELARTTADASLAWRSGTLWASAGAAAAGSERALVLITGSHHMQSFWMQAEDPGGGTSLLAFPWAWLIDDHRWIARQSLFLRPPGRPPAAPGEWNGSCVKCHTTAPGGPVESTRVAELGIACEACHGPGQGHQREHQSPLRRYRWHRASARGGAHQGPPDPTIVLPTRLGHTEGSAVCGQCHSIWVFPDEAEAARFRQRGSRFRPGQRLEGSKQVLRRAGLDQVAALRDTLASMPDFADRYFWRDGTVRVTGREYNGLIESACYQRGELACTSCHQLHAAATDPRPLSAWADDQLQAEAGDDGDGPCRRCHGGLAASVERHAHHPANSSGSRCLNCHMPNTNFGLLGASRSHRIASPSVRESLESGRPNACNGCHLDRTLAWTAAALQAWYGQPVPPLDPAHGTVAAAVLWALSGDAGQRALAAWSFGWPPARLASSDAGPAPDDWMVPVLAVLLDDPYDAVRLVAGRSLSRLVAGRDVAYDFAAPAPERQALRHALLERALRSPPGGGRPERAQLPSGAPDLPQLERLLERRDDRSVSLWE